MKNLLIVFAFGIAMSSSGSLKAQSDSVCFTHEVAELIAKQLADFKEVSNDYASLQRSYAIQQAEVEILQLRHDALKNLLKTSMETKRKWRKSRIKIAMEL